MFQKNKKLAVLVSDVGMGTNLQAIIDGVNEGKIKSEISAVISDKENTPALERAKKHNLRIEICPKKEALLPLLQKIAPDYICLAGWKQIILDEVILAFSNKILNLHPGLIPDTVNGVVGNPDSTPALWNKGMLTTKAIQNFLDQKSTFAGSSIHFLTLNFDFGPVLGRTFEKIETGDTVDSLYTRLKKKENEMYVEVLGKLTSPQPSLDRRGSKSEVLKILIIGAGGGREHALGWKIAQSPRAGELFFARGNAGTAQLGTNLDIKETETTKLLEFAKKPARNASRSDAGGGKIDLTLVLSDDPLAIGTIDEFQKAGLRVWGPSKAASELEWSKAYAKDFMKRHQIPTSKYEVFNDFEKAKKYVEKGSVPVVIKASGLALGKGVTVAQTKEEAIKTLHAIFIDKIFGASGNEVVIEEYLKGTEISIHAISDGKNFKMFPSSQDHKRIFDGNAGPNTGGMGVIAPLPFVNDVLMKRIEKKIVAPTLEGMAKEGRPFVGILYPGIMLTKEGPRVFEFNARFGDPEAQTYMRLLDTDILDILDASIDGKIADLKIKWKKNTYACNIALASGGYPGSCEKGKMISGIPPLLVKEGVGGGDIVIFHASTKIVMQDLTTNGGRVLGISATGKSLKKSLDKAYEAISKISFEGMQYRKDIGKKALELSKLS